MGNRILLIDDDYEILRIMRDALESAGHQVEVCENGNEVMKTIRAYKPELLLLDVMLPGVDGYSLTKQIAKNPATRNLPIIVLSGLEPSRAMFQQFPQVAAFFTKPFNPAELLEAAEKALTKKPENFN